MLLTNCVALVICSVLPVILQPKPQKRCIYAKLKHSITELKVSEQWKQFQNDGTVVSRPGQGRKRMTTASEDRYLALTARRNRKATARQLSSELAAATGAVASRQTIYRRLNEKGLYARKPRVCVLLSSQKRGIALIGVKNIKTGLNINGPMFSLLMSRGLV
ncbi:transposable element Tcb2 transposase [Trichonephila clavipes]|nr:transposable element Tcb2 transposase [Trichonephila clavipes]